MIFRWALRSTMAGTLLFGTTVGSFGSYKSVCTKFYAGKLPTRSNGAIYYKSKGGKWKRAKNNSIHSAARGRDIVYLRILSRKERISPGSVLVVKTARQSGGKERVVRLQRNNLNARVVKCRNRHGKLVTPPNFGLKSVSYDDYQRFTSGEIANINKINKQSLQTLKSFHFWYAQKQGRTLSCDIRTDDIGSYNRVQSSLILKETKFRGYFQKFLSVLQTPRETTSAQAQEALRRWKVQLHPYDLSNRDSKRGKKCIRIRVGDLRKIDSIRISDLQRRLSGSSNNHFGDDYVTR